MEMRCAECGCLVDRGIRIAECGDPGCCCRDLPVRAELEAASTPPDGRGVNASDPAAASSQAVRQLAVPAGQIEHAHARPQNRSIPAGRAAAGHSLVMADAQAAERVRGVAPAHRDGDQG